MALEFEFCITLVRIPDAGGQFTSMTVGATAVSFEYGENRSYRYNGDNASLIVWIIARNRPGQAPKRSNVSHDVAVDQGGKVWHADER
jgi:hypothetical protein